MIAHLEEITRRLAAPAREAWSLPRHLIPMGGDTEEQWFDRSRAARAGTLTAVGSPAPRSLVSTLAEGAVYISAPSGRGKSHVASLVAREGVDGEGLPVLVLSAQDVELGLVQDLRRIYPEIGDLNNDQCARLLTETRCVVVIDDWERASPEQRRSMEREARRMIDGGARMLFLGTPDATPPRVEGVASLRLLALTPRERREYLQRRLRPSDVDDADRMAQLLEPISSEAFFLAKIADYCSARRPDDGQDPRSIIAIMRRLLNIQLSSRCPSDHAVQFVAVLQDLAHEFDRFSVQDVARSLASIGGTGLAGALVSIGLQAGLLRQPHLNSYEFAHSLWRAFFLVASANEDATPNPSDIQRWMTSATARLRDAVGAMVPWAELQEPERTTLLRRAAFRDLQAYRNALRALDVVDAPDQGLHSFISGIEDMGALLSDSARMMVEPWSLYGVVPAGRPGAVRVGPWFTLRLRGGDEPIVVDVTSREASAALQPPTGRERIMSTLSRWEGAEFVVEQLRVLLKRGCLPYDVLAAERVAYFEAVVGQRIGTVGRLRSLARRHVNDLLLAKGGVLLNGGYRPRFERCANGLQGFTGTEINEWLDIAALDDDVKLRELRHPGPDRKKPRTFRERYSPAQRLRRLKSVVPMAVAAFEHLVRDHFPFLLPHSPFASGPSQLVLLVEGESGRIYEWWEPCLSAGESPRLELVPTSQSVNVEAIEEQVIAKAARLRREVERVIVSHGHVVEWNPYVEAARVYTCKLLTRALVRSCDRDVWYVG